MQFFLKIVVFTILLRVLNFAQPVKVNSAADIQLAIEKLKVLGSVLYIGAHPDDENTGLIAYLSKSKKLRTAYLSLTRGDGGQNLIGSEKGIEIGIIRTQELLRAREIDGGEQFFTRAIDFGYSKSAEEALRIWGRNEILSDMVWIIRKFRPDIIITRFPIGSSGGHGHHTASALLTDEAFTAAADSLQFTDQLKYVKPWRTKKLFWNNWRPAPNETAGLLAFDVGEFNPLLGKSYTEFAAESRSMHKSQGFGSTPSRGSRMEYLQLIKGDNSGERLFDNINNGWERIKDGENIGRRLNLITESFNQENPSASLDQLINLLKELDKLESDNWVDIKRKELLSIIQSCAGLWMESISDDYSASAGDSVKITTTVINRSGKEIKIERIGFPTIPADSTLDANLVYNKPFTVLSTVKIPMDYKISQPYWLIGKPSEGLFTIPDMQQVGPAENSFSIPVNILLSYSDVKLEYTVPLLYRWNDRVDGEQYRPFEIRPPVTAGSTERISVFPDERSKEIQIKLKSNTGAVSGEVHLHSESNWKIYPAAIPFSFENKYDEKLLTVSVTPPAEPGNSSLDIEINTDGLTYNKAMVEISYPHIKRQVYFPDSQMKLVKLDIKKYNSNIGYIMGSGDEIPECLRNLGYNVTLLNDDALESGDLDQYDAIITGIRAYNTRDRLKYSQPKLLEYVKNGGTLISQYNVAFGLQTDNLGPYPLALGRERITDENSDVKFIKPNHQLLNFPNKISTEDFKGWVQERGLYFADQWDQKYETVYGGHDVNENDLNGGTLFTRFGKGVFIFSGYAWFRQLPAGVPGAYRIFVNMIEAGKYGGKNAE